MPLPNDLSRACDEISKLASSNPEYTGAKKKAARQLARESYEFEKLAADGAAATTTLYTAAAGFRAPRDGRLLGAYFIPHAALVGDNANNATLNMNKSDGAGGAATNMAGSTTNVAYGNFVAGGIKTLALNATLANTRFTKGQLISPSIAKSGTGVVVPDGTWQIDVEYEGTDDYEVV
jgi:hypothetical protein